ncbi:MAG: alpha/beta hydrolase [Alphaproteobacteria bacterium]|nr:alpha/beta hydrolase [Alphaproteobacteria bacterium]
MQDFLVGFVIFYLCLTGILYLQQRNLIYFPYKKRVEAPENAEIAQVKTEDGLELQGWYFAPKEGKPVLVYFHGNAGSIANRLIKFPDYLEAGYGVLFAEYRAYGGNPGTPSEDGFYRDGWAYMGWLVSEKGIGPERTVLYGESLGTGIAVELGAKLSAEGKPPLALVLETPFSSLLDMARRNYFFIPVDYLLLDRYMNVEKISSVKASLLIASGKYDNTIPPAQSRILFEAANEPKRFVEFPKGHHEDLHLFGLSTAVIDFLAGIEARNRDN